MIHWRRFEWPGCARNFRRFIKLNSVTAKEILTALTALADSAIAAHSFRFFKAGPGEYGEGDKFLGIRVPALRATVNRYENASLKVASKVLKSDYHEARLFALLLLVRKFERGDKQDRQAIYTLYLAHTEWINNWDLVDSSAHKIVGAHLVDKDRAILFQLANSSNLWERRIAMMATYTFIKQNQFDDALQLAEALLEDAEDLIHKIVGWMLREVGKRDIDTVKTFLTKHYNTMPRTMLRYAIEKFPESDRKAYLSGAA